MKQVLQNISNGETQLVDVPCPEARPGNLLIATSRSLVSVGTERMLIDFGKANWVSKARQQPDKVKQVLDKIKTDGVQPTIEAVMSKLDQPIPLGYCNVGRVVSEMGTEFRVGDRVVSNGQHAEIVRVPKNLCALVPDNVDDESAAFTVIGSIALQGVRLLKPTVGEVVVVTGLGLIGLLTVQLLRANGCRVLGIDFDSVKCEIAQSFGAETVDLSKGENPLTKAEEYSRGRGVDGVIITASTKSNEPMSQAAAMCRKRGRIILVGVAGLELSRADFFEKELKFQVSCSYGPGRYDENYEQKGHDYPVGFVRWTEQRNFEAVLDLMSDGSLDVRPLITHNFEIDHALEAYKMLENRSALGVLLHYSLQDQPTLQNKSITLSNTDNDPSAQVVIGCLGAGNYASRVLIPAFKSTGVKLDTIVTSGGITAVHHGRKNNFLKASTEANSIFESPAINTVVIATRHNQHATQICEALRAGKHVFVEKPLGLSHKEVDEIETAYNEQEGKCKLMLGYNRRFAPHTQVMKQLMGSVSSPKVMVMTMNAGFIPSDHWTQDVRIGGGRIIGEACHYIDLMRYLADSKIASFSAISLGNKKVSSANDDTAAITISFENGSMGTIHYLSNGGKAFPKERVEVFADGAVLQLDNFRKLKGYNWQNFKHKKLLKQDKGQTECVKTFVDAVQNGLPAPISSNEIFEVARATIDIAALLR